MLGNGIKILRNKRGMTQAKLAGLIGTTQSYLSLLENNTYSPSKTMLDELCRALNVDAILIYWLGIDESNVPTDKIETFRVWRERINDLLVDIFDKEVK